MYVLKLARIMVCSGAGVWLLVALDKQRENRLRDQRDFCLLWQSQFMRTIGESVRTGRLDDDVASPLREYRGSECAVLTHGTSASL